MINVKIRKENNKIKEIIFDGHAGYDDYGKDIVCAAVSATMLCTVNGIFSIDGDSIDVKEEDDTTIINILKSDNITIKLIDNMIRCLENIEKNYPKNIKISKEE